MKAASDGEFTTVKYLEQTQYSIEYYNTCKADALDNEPTNPELTALNYGAMLDMLKTKTSTISCLLYTSPSPRDKRQSRMPSSA